MKRTQKHGATVIFSKSPLSLSTKSVSKVSSLSLSPQTSLVLPKISSARDTPKKSHFEMTESHKTKFDSFLDDLKSYSFSERRRTLDIIKDIEKEKETTPIAQKKTSGKLILSKILVNSKEENNYIKSYFQNVSKFYTSSKSGKSFLHKTSMKKMEEI